MHVCWTAISGLLLHDVALTPGSRTLPCNLSTSCPCLVVPLDLRNLVFDLLHGLSPQCPANTASGGQLVRMAPDAH